MPSDSSPLPGSLTVPPLHGWVGLVVLLVLAVVVAVGFVIAESMSRSDSRSTEWESWLEGRSRSTAGAPPADREDRAPESAAVHPRR